MKKSLKKIIDNIGFLYTSGKTEVDEGKSKMESAKEKAFTLLQNLHPDKEESAGVIGEKFHVGFFTRTPASVFDPELFRKLYPKDFEKCVVTRKIFDEEKMMQLVREKKIDPKHLLGATIQGKPSKVIDISPL